MRVAYKREQSLPMERPRTLLLSGRRPFLSPPDSSVAATLLPILQDNLGRAAASLDSRECEPFALSINGIAQYIKDAACQIVPDMFSLDFCQFLIDALHIFFDTDSVAAVLRLSANLSVGHVPSRRFFHESQLIDFAFQQLESDSSDVVLHSLRNIGLLIEFYPEDSPLPFEIEDLFRLILALESEDLQVAIEASRLLQNVIRFRDFERHLPSITRCIYALCDGYPNADVLDFAARMLLMLLQCDVGFLRRIYDDQLVDVIARTECTKPLQSLLIFVDKALELMPRPFTYWIARVIESSRLCRLVKSDNDRLAILAMSIVEQLVRLEVIEPSLRRMEVWRRILKKKVIQKVVKALRAATWEKKMAIARFVGVCLETGSQRLFQVLTKLDYLKRLTALADGARDRPTMKLFVDTCCYVLLIAEKCGEKEIVRQHINELGIPDYIDPLRDDEELAEEAYRFFNEIDCPEEARDGDV